MLNSSTSDENIKSYNHFGGAWLAQSVERETLHLRVMSSSPTAGVEFI